MTESKPLAIVIDDDVHLGEAFRQALELSGFRAKHISDSNTAHEILITEQPAIVLLDMSMPGLNGAEVLDLIRGDEKTADIKVIIVTANPLTLNEFVMDNSDLVLQKPVSLNQIKDFAKRMLVSGTKP